MQQNRTRSLTQGADFDESGSRKLFALTLFLLGVVGLLYGSLVPGRLRPRSGLDGHIEHGLAYALGGAALLPLLSSPLHVLTAGAGLVALAAVLEFAQRWIPGRSCRMTHFLASASGVLVPTAAGLALTYRTVARCSLWS